MHVSRPTRLGVFLALILGFLTVAMGGAAASVSQPATNLTSDDTPSPSDPTAPGTGSPGGQTRDDESSDPILFIGMTGVSTSDIDFTNPVIAEHLGNAGFANALVRSVSPFTCPGEGWMSLVAPGDVIDQEGRSEVSDLADRCPTFDVTETESADPLIAGAGSAQVDEFSRMTETVRWPAESPFSPDALGIGPGAAVALADESGRAQNWMPFSRDDLGEALKEAPGDVVVDIGSVRARPSDTFLRTYQYERTNARLAAVLEANAESGVDRRIVVASVGVSWNIGELQFFATTGLDDSGQLEGPGVIASASTRADGFIAAADIRTVIAGTGDGLTLLPEDSVADAVSFLLVEENHATFSRIATSTWYQVFNAFALIGIVAAVALFLVRPGRSPSSWTAPKSLWAAVTYWNRFVFAFVPAALLLNFLPWWRLPLEGSAITYVPIACTVVLAALLTLAASRFKHPVAVLAIIALVLLGGDVILGSAHQRNGFMGSLMLTSRRFYGISNRTYLILIVAGLLAVLPAIARAQETVKRFGAATPQAKAAQRRAGITVALVGFVILLIDALPAWGADFGGPPGIIAGFGIVALLAAGIRLRWWHLPVWIVLSVATMGLVGIADSRSGSDSHIGEFWSSLGSAESFELIQGKIRDVVRSFVGRLDILVMLAAVIVFAVLIVLALRQLNKRSGMHVSQARELAAAPGFTMVTVGILAGILIAVPINDSGALMLKEGFYIAVPALIALLAGEHLRLRSMSRTEPELRDPADQLEQDTTQQ
ncbi:hypothetical protein VR010_12535 [Actinomycetaceae bacterium L2_0104]